jgi:hypothetical protein
MHCKVCQNSCQYSDLLWAGQSGDWILVGAKFSALIQTDPGAHPASCTVGTGSFPRVNRQGCGVDHPWQSSAEVKERVELAFMACSRWTLPLPFTNELQERGWTLSCDICGPSIHWSIVGPIYRVTKKSLCTWWLKYRKLQVMFKVSPASLLTFIDMPNCFLKDTRLTLMPSVIHNCN